MNKYYFSVPVVPLRGLVVLPGELIHFDAGRTRSVSAISAATAADTGVFLTSQTDPKKNEVAFEDVYPTGCYCRVKQVLDMPGESVRVLVEGVERGKLLSFDNSGSFVTADIAALDITGYPNEVENEAYRRRLMTQLREYATVSNRITADIVSAVEKKTDISELADAVANVIATKAEQRQQILETPDVTERLALVASILSSEVEILHIDRRIAAEVKRSIDKNQREYYLREQIKVIKTELGDDAGSEADTYRERMAKKVMPDEVMARLKKEIDRFSELPMGSHEGPSMQNYIECLLDLPWEETTEDRLSLDDARRILDEDHFGLEKVKERIIEFLAVAKLTGKVNGQILCFVGPPGVGKTSVSSSVARALGRKFVRMSLGGIRDEAEIRGHRRTYIGAMPGRIIAAMRQAGTVNPVLLFDEIDKLTGDYHGDPAAAMLEVLDSAQNFAFRDHFLEIPYDLSQVLFITTANDRNAIPAPLLDRMEVIEVPSYLETEKLEIAKRHLLPKQMSKNGLKKSMLTVPDERITDIIREYTAESGVRQLERELGAVCRKAACEIGGGKKRVRVTAQRLTDYLGQPKRLHRAAEREAAVGLVNGLAWTAVGGETLEIEAVIMNGTGQIAATGKLGDVMQESAKAALTYVRAHAAELGIDAERFKTTDIHVHVPAGAVPKDGPSAGIAIMTAIASALTGIPVRAGVAMTGEITIRGTVLPIGGLREKLLAAVRAGIHTAILPKDNKPDMEDVPDEAKDALKIIYVTEAMSVLHAALTAMPVQKLVSVRIPDMPELKDIPKPQHTGTAAMQ